MLSAMNAVLGRRRLPPAAFFRAGLVFVATANVRMGGQFGYTLHAVCLSH